MWLLAGTWIVDLELNWMRVEAVAGGRKKFLLRQLAQNSMSHKTYRLSLTSDVIMRI